MNEVNKQRHRNRHIRDATDINRHRIGLVRAANIIIELNKSGLLNNTDWKQKAARYHFKF
ncbi:hypothetical protein KIJ14_01780 [Leuconostoc gelidum subsp. gelidum]|nr:hypothetical protein [Leuconostoc gelidum subsp. gelidum]